MDIDEYLIDTSEMVQENYIKVLQEIEDDMHFPATHLSKSSMAGGKMFRPMLVMLANQACGGNPKEALDFAVALQMFHSASLVHDDIIDHDSTRRGLPALHEVMSAATAIITGDAAFAKGMSLMTKYGPKVTHIASQTVYALARGAILEAVEFGKGTFDHDMYIDVITGKTASLFATCCQVGAISAIAPKHIEQACWRYGRDLGILFQIIDDTVDVLASVKSGVATGDVLEKKITLPFYEVFMAEEAMKVEWLKFSKQKAPFQDLVAKVKIDGSGFQKVKKAVLEYKIRAIKELEFLPPSEYRDVMVQLPDFVTELMLQEKDLLDIWNKI